MSTETPATQENQAAKYASRVLRDRHALVTSASLADDYRLLTQSAIYLKGFSCAPDDLDTMRSLARDLDEHAAMDKGFIEWSKHQKHEDPDAISATFRAVVGKMARYFDVEVYATRFATRLTLDLLLSGAEG